MQRLSIEIVNRMCKANLTRCEIDFLLAVSRYQDDAGKVTGVYYKDIAAEMNFSIPQFYAAKKGLEEKGFIQCQKNNYFDHDILIIGNSYIDIYNNQEENLKNKPYINTRHEIFYDEAFHSLKPGAKLLAMLFMGNSRMNGGAYKIGVKKLFEKYIKILHVKERIIRVYMTQLREFFSIGIVNGLYHIRPKKLKVYRQSGKTEIDNYNEHQIKMVCRRNYVKVNHEKDIEDVRVLVKQYRKKVLDIGKDILNIVTEGICCSIDPSEDMSSKGILKPKLVHKWVRRLIGIAETEKDELRSNKSSKESKNKGKNSFNNFHQRDYNFDEIEKALILTNKI